jgi:hypothetical protein
VHVDDGICTGVKEQVKAALNEIADKTGIKDIGEAKEFLSLEIRQNSGRLWIGQQGYIEEILQRFDMAEASPVRTPLEVGQAYVRAGEPVSDKTPYSELIGALLYLATMNRPDISYAVGVLCRFMQAPTVQHWRAAKRVLRYLKGTKKLGIVYTQGGGAAEAYGDSDYAADTDERRSRSGVVIVKNGGALTWRSRLQTTVALSTCEAEINSGAAAARDALWVRLLLGELDGKVQCMPLYCDNQSALAMMREYAAGTGGRKHVDIAYQFVRNRVMRGEISVVMSSLLGSWQTCLPKHC